MEIRPHFLCSVEVITRHHLAFRHSASSSESLSANAMTNHYLVLIFCVSGSVELSSMVSPSCQHIPVWLRLAGGDRCLTSS